MSQIVPFSFEGLSVRVVVVDGQQHFVGKDVCDALGYANSSKAMNDHCKGVTVRYPVLTNGGMQKVRLLSEPDLMRLIVGSSLPAAQRFEAWVFEEVLPSVRKTGGYLMEGPALNPCRLRWPNRSAASSRRWCASRSLTR